MRIALATPDEWESCPETLSEFAPPTFTSWQAVGGEEAGSARAPRCRPAIRRQTRLSWAERRATQGDRVSIELAGRWPILGRVLPAAWLDVGAHASTNGIPYFFYN
jgi:hypothetical protein